MNWFFTRRCLPLFLLLVTALTTGTLVQAQTITITRVLPAAPCPGSPVSVTFTTTGSFLATNVFTLQLSSGVGNFTTPTSVTTLSSAPTTSSTLVMSGTLPVAEALPYGTGYRFQVRSGAPIITSAATAPTIIGTPPPTPGSSVYTFCRNSGLQPITATGTGTIDWYNGLAAAAPVVAPNTSTYNAPTTSSPVTYYVAQTIGGCRSAKVPVTVNLETAPANKPSVTYTKSPYCPTTNPPALSASLNGGASLRWYVDTPTSPGSTTTATAPAPPTTTGLYAYTVTQLSSAGCEGPSEQFTIRVYDPAPTAAPDVANLNPSLCRYNLPAALTATTNGTGTSLFWTGPGITTPVNGPTLTLGTTAQAGTYQVRQENANGCLSQPRNVNLTINDRPATPGVANVSVCHNEAQQTLTVTDAATGTLTWYVQGSTTPLPAAPRPATSTPNSQTIYEVTRTDNTGCTSLKSAGLTFAVRPLPASPTLSGAYVYCEAQAPASLTASGNRIRWYSDAGTLLDNTTIAAPKAAGNYTYRATQTDANNCQSDFLAVPVQVKDTPELPGITYANAIANYCQGQASSALTATGTGLRWYTSPTSASLAQAPEPATTNRGDTPYYVTQTNAVGCQSDQRLITARVNLTPGAPTSAQSRTYCAGETPAPLTATEPGTRWYAAATGGTGSGPPVVSTAASNVGTPQLFYVSQTVGSCESQQRQAVSVTVKRKPAPPTNVSAPAFCQNYAPSSLSAQTESGALLRWVNGTAETATPPVTPTGAARDYTYQVLQVLDGCRSEQVAVTVTVKPTPGTPEITPYSLCVGRESRALQVKGTDLTYYTAADVLLGTVAPAPSTSQSTTAIYRVSQSLAGCEGPKATYSVPVYPIPANPTFTQPRAYCAEDAATPLIANGEKLLWYNVLTGGTGNGQAPQPTTNASNVPAPQTFYVTQTVLGCESERQVISVTVKRKPDVPGSVSNIEFCQNYPAPALTATRENGAKIIWVSAGNESETAPVPPADAVRSYAYQVLQELDGCRSNRLEVTARVKPTPGQPRTTPFDLCQLSPGRALDAVGNDLKFYDTNNTLLGTTAPVITTEQARTITYRVTQSINGCEGPKIDYAVVVKPKPAPPATQAVSYCIEGPNYPDQPKQNVQPLTAGGENLRWFFVDGNPFPERFTPTPATSNTYVASYQVTQTVNNCVSDKGFLQVSVLATPTPIVSASVVTYCRNEVSRPLEATGTNLRWIDFNGGAATTETPSPPTLNATKGNETYQVYAIGANGCASARNSIRLIVNTNPTLSLLGSTTINYGQTATLQLRFTSSPPYTYTLTDGTAGVATDTLSLVAVKPLQTITYRVASVSNVCGNGLPGNPATATIFVNVPRLTTTALTTATVCAGTTFAVSYTTTGAFNAGNAFKIQIADTTAKTYVDVSAAGLGNPLTATLPASLRGGTYFVRVLATNPGAEVGGLPSPTVLTVRGLPGATLSGTQDIYESYPANLSISFIGDGPWTVGYTIDGTQTSTFQTNANPHVLTVQPPKTAIYSLTAVSNNCGTGPVSGTATVTVLPLLAVEDPLADAVSLYPVPTQNQLTVAIDLPLTPANPARLTLRDLTGLPVISRQTDTQRTILDLSQQPAGLYLLSVEVGDHRVVRRVLKL